jgi:hypothetical protein
MRRPSICDSCARLHKRPNPQAETSLETFVPYCDAFPDRIPNKIYLGGYDHRMPFEGDGGILYEFRPGKEKALTAYEHRIATKRTPAFADAPIEPLPGEPPLTLFRDTTRTELRVGTRIDRYGDPSGNVVYTAGTPFSARSLPADWATRPYHVYEVTRRLPALTGTAIPWFEQPGGGTAHVLPAAIDRLLVDRYLQEAPA